MFLAVILSAYNLPEILKARLQDSKLLNWFRSNKDRSRIAAWESEGCPVPPPPAYKWSVIREAAKTHSLSVLVETGTYQGHTIARFQNTFEEIHSVELSERLYLAAVERFRENTNVFLYQGDSSQVLPVILSKITKPTLFWLDAHYSGKGTSRGQVDTPIVEELELIMALRDQGHVLLIDDARLFTGASDYPTVWDCRKIVASSCPRYTVDVMHDIIKICPKGSRN